jgi:hypothetical protein
MPRMRPILRSAILALAVATLGACSMVVQRATDGLSTGLTSGISNHDDIATVADGLPAYLLLLDGLIEGDPGNAALLLSAARLYGTYAGGFVADAERAKRLADRSFGYARRGICARDRAFCAQLDSTDFDAFNAFVADHVRAKDVDAAYVLASSWVGWLRADSADWNRVADLPRIETLLNRVNELSPAHDHGNVLAYLGVLDCLRPESLGGKPSRGQQRLAAADAVDAGKNLLPKVLNAEYCARLLFDQEAHDRMLAEVQAADANVPGLTLSNTIAKRRAAELVVSGKDYF